MDAFFNSPERIAQLNSEARLWIDTPFISHACIRGVGVDCVHLVAAIYISCGTLDHFDPPTYAIDSGSHSVHSQVLEWLDNHPAFVRVHETPKEGDTVCFKPGLSEHHIGLMLEPRKFVHVLARRRVIISSLDERYYACRLSATYRPHLAVPQSRFAPENSR